MTYVDCPKCNKKFHPNAVSCPRCKVTPDQYHAKLEARLAQKQQAREQRQLARTLYCKSCGSSFNKGKTVRLIKGSFVLEVLLWCFFMLPGLAYTVYRQSTKAKGCPVCRSAAIIPANTPLAQQAL